MMSFEVNKKTKKKIERKQKQNGQSNIISGQL
jgi:hypothetical protein